LIEVSKEKKKEREREREGTDKGRD